MADELFCSEHGPYAASLGRCPYCGQGAQNLPPAPSSLFRDDFIVPEGAGGDNDETILPGKSPSSRSLGSEGQVDDITLPPSRERGRRSSAGDGDDITQPPQRRRPSRGGDPDEEGGGTVIDRPDRHDITPMAWLIVKKSPCFRRGHILKVRSGAIYGHSESKADVLIDDDKVSGIHMRIQIKENQFFLVDLGSSNGTWLNDKEVVGSVEIHQDDEIKIGDTIFVLKTLCN